MKLVVDGFEVARAQGPAFALQFETRHFANGQHRLSVVAEDAGAIESIEEPNGLASGRPATACVTAASLSRTSSPMYGSASSSSCPIGLETRSWYLPCGLRRETGRWMSLRKTGVSCTGPSLAPGLAWQWNGTALTPTGSGSLLNCCGRRRWFFNADAVNLAPCSFRAQSNRACLKGENP